MIRSNLSPILFLFFYLTSHFFGVNSQNGGSWFQEPGLLILTAIPFFSVLWGILRKTSKKGFAFWSLFCSLIGAYPILMVTSDGVGAGLEIPGIWVYLTGHLFLTWDTLSRISNTNYLEKRLSQLIDLLIPFLFGMWLLFLWEVIVNGFGVPKVLLPPPSLVGEVFVDSIPVLWADFVQTIIKSALPGFAIGCSSGFIVAILVDRVPFLERGLLPFGNFISALPIVGIAPIMVMWFGFDWQSKAAVVVVMTFFPMLVNMISGLKAAGKIERELVHTYHPSPLQSLIKVRLPYALPFLFNALKINSTLAIIGAIVAEFFGTPIVGMGFRISTEVGRMNIELVWATIGVSAIAGSIFYGLLALLERISTFWHPSYQR